MSNNTTILKIVSAVQTLCIAGMVTYLYKDNTTVKSFDEINVERINIAGDDGKNQMVLAIPDRSPPPVLNGVEYPRSTKPGGIIIYDGDGNETGGLVTTNLGKDGKITANQFILDYINSEAIGMVKFEKPNGDYYAGIKVLDRLDLDKDIMENGSAGANRIDISTYNSNASITLMDTASKPRIQLSVDENDVARIQMLDAEGNVTFSIPEVEKTAS